MLERWFLSKMSSTGKVVYWIGAVSMVAAFLIIVFTSRTYGGLGYYLGFAAVIIGWGFGCMMVFPKPKPTEYPDGGPPGAM